MIEPLPDGRRPPSHVKDALDTLASTLGLSSVDHTEQLFSGWPAIVGEDLATRCKPVRLNDGELRIVTADQGWATELRWMSNLIMERCNEALGAGLVTSVRVVLGHR